MNSSIRPASTDPISIARAAQTVFVIDGDGAARKSLTLLMRSDGWTSRAFGTASAFLEQLHQDQQGCILSEARMSDLDGMELVCALNARACLMPVIFVTGCASVPLVLRAMKAGVVDVIEKPSDDETILKAARSALTMAPLRILRVAERADFERRRNTLTERERQVLGLVIDGFPNKVIAARLGISFRTVEIHRAGVMTKMGAGSLPELVRMSLYDIAA